jgi:hypothetical protein
MATPKTLYDLGEFELAGTTTGTFKYMAEMFGRKVTQYVLKKVLEDRKEPPKRIAVIIKVLDDD